MRNTLSNPLRLFTLALSVAVFAPVSSLRAEEAGDVCALSVCDVDAYVAELKGLGHVQRDQKIMADLPALLEKNRKTTNVEVWQNLARLGEATKAYIDEAADAEKWVYNEVANFIDVSMLSLFKYGPATADDLYTAFTKISSSGRRYEALVVWESIGKNQDFEVVQAVVEFATKAEALTRKLDDAAWVTNKAREIAVNGSARLAALDPIVEGQYRIRLVKDANFDNLCTELDGVDTLVVANWMTAEGLVASMINSKTGKNRAYFKNSVVSEAGTRIRAQSLSAGTSSRLTLLLNKEAGTLAGSYTSTRLGCTYRIEGTRLHTPGAYMRDGALKLDVKPTLQSVTGIYKATFTSNGRTAVGRFIIRQHEQSNGSVLAASFVRDNFSQDFQFGYLVGPRAFMIFNSGSGEQNLTRWDMAYRADENGNYAWRGRMFSLLNGVMGTLVLEKISDLGNDAE